MTDLEFAIDKLESIEPGESVRVGRFTASVILTELARLEAELTQLRHAIKDAQVEILFMPTSTHGDSYAAAIDMRKRCHEAVAKVTGVNSMIAHLRSLGKAGADGGDW